jgi:hypothetical protein
MTAATAGREDGITLLELLLVVALMGTALSVMFGAVQVLSRSASASTEESAAAHDLSYSMELLSKTIMGGTVLYANDNQLVVLTRGSGVSWQVNSITATKGVDPASTRGRLIWERWSCDASGTAPTGTYHNVWVMSDRNVNRYTAPPIALFAYYKSSTDSSLMGAGDRLISSGGRVSAFTGTLPDGYLPTAVGRIRLHVASAFNAGVRDDLRDIVLRLGS